MFRFVFLSVCLFVWIKQSSGGNASMFKHGPSSSGEKIFSPAPTEAAETTATSTRATEPTTTKASSGPSATPYLDKLDIAIVDFYVYPQIILSDAIAKEQDALNAKILKVVVSFGTQRRALVTGIRNFGFSAVLDDNLIYALADKVSGIIYCMKNAELELEYLPIGITGDFKFPESANTFEEELLWPSQDSVVEPLFYSSDFDETCARKLDLTSQKLLTKFGSTFAIWKKCASSFTSVNLEDLKAFETRAALALKQVEPVVKAISSCKWTLSKGYFLFDICVQNIIRLADASSICDDTSALGPLLRNILTASYNAVTYCVNTAYLSGVVQSAALSLQGEITAKCGLSLSIRSEPSNADRTSLWNNSSNQATQIKITTGNRRSSDFMKNFLKKIKEVELRRVDNKK